MKIYKCKHVTYPHGKQTITEPEVPVENAALFYNGEFVYVVGYTDGEPALEKLSLTDLRLILVTEDEFFENFPETRDFFYPKETNKNQ